MSLGAIRRHSGGMQTANHSAAPLGVFLVEDSALIRTRLEAMVALAGATIAGHANTVGGAIRSILDARPDLVILDIQLADGTGFDVLRALADQAPGIDVVLFSNFSAYPYRQLAERLGARGFFDKSKEFEGMRDAVAQRVAARH
jgi:DNA-binding NarL/FixJ family response regulator